MKMKWECDVLYAEILIHIDILLLDGIIQSPKHMTW